MAGITIEVKGEGSAAGVVLPGKPPFKGPLLGVVGTAGDVRAIVADRESQAVISVSVDDIESWTQIA